MSRGYGWGHRNEVVRSLRAAGHQEAPGVCHKCWGEAYLRVLDDPSKQQWQHYNDIIDEAERLAPDSPPEAP